MEGNEVNRGTGKCALFAYNLGDYVGLHSAGEGRNRANVMEFRTVVGGGWY